MSADLPLLQDPDAVELCGTLERVIFHNEENGYTVLRLQPDKPLPRHIEAVPLGAGVDLFPQNQRRAADRTAQTHRRPSIPWIFYCIFEKR